MLGFLSLKFWCWYSSDLNKIPQALSIIHNSLGYAFKCSWIEYYKQQENNHSVIVILKIEIKDPDNRSKIQGRDEVQGDLSLIHRLD